MESVEELKKRNLWSVAEHYGFSLNAKESSTHTKAYCRDDKKINITQLENGRYVWIINKTGQSGSIIDFLMLVENINSTEAIRKLRSKIYSKTTPRSAPKIDKSYREIKQFIRSETEISSINPYLASRGISDRTLVDSRIHDSILIHKKTGNTIFPHQDESGFTGYEIKNYRFTGFAKNGSKSLWASKCSKSDNKIVLAETAIDALSYFQLKKPTQARLFSTGGRTSKFQDNLIAKAVSKLNSPLVILAFDNDPGGEKLIRHLRDFLKDIPCQIVADLPDEANDWNEQLTTSGRG